jgi:hypothetical protein
MMGWNVPVWMTTREYGSGMTPPLQLLAFSKPAVDVPFQTAEGCVPAASAEISAVDNARL